MKFLLQDAHCNANISNKLGQTPLLVTASHRIDIIKILISHGASIADACKMFQRPVPSESAVKVFVVGKQGAGKSTLTKALELESGSLLNRLVRVSDVAQNTAGMIYHDIESRKLGHITLYDLAGHEEFYSGHATMLHSSMSDSSAVFLLVTDLSLSDEEIRESIVYWLAFLFRASQKTKSPMLSLWVVMLISLNQKKCKGNKVWLPLLQPHPYSRAFILLGLWL